jgi:hypothetical protein
MFFSVSRAIPFRGIGVTLLAICQTLAYYFYLPIGMGPHIILEPWLLNQGWRIYQELSDHHTPLMQYLMAFAQQIIGDELRAGKLVLVTLLLIIFGLVYLLTRQRASRQAALLSIVFFVFWSPSFQFGILRFEAFLTVFYLLAWLLWPARQQTHLIQRAFLAGLILGFAFLIKQHAIVYLTFFLGWQLIANDRTILPFKRLIQPILITIMGFSLPGIFFLGGYILTGGALDRLFFWVVAFNNAELARMLAGAPTLIEIQQLLPTLLLVPWYFVWLWHQIKTGQAGWVSAGTPLSLIFAGIFLCFPRFGPEHLQPALPGLAILSGISLDQLLSASFQDIRWRRTMAGALLALWVLYPVSGVLGTISPNQPRYIHEYSPLLPLAERVEQLIGREECPYIFPEDEANSNLYYFLNCSPPGRLWLFTNYPWFSRFDLPEQSVKALQSAPPHWVVYFPHRWWNVEEHNPRLTEFVNANYEMKYVLDFENKEVWFMERR